MITLTTRYLRMSVTDHTHYPIAMYVKCAWCAVFASDIYESWRFPHSKYMYIVVGGSRYIHMTQNMSSGMHVHV